VILLLDGNSENLVVRHAAGALAPYLAGMSIRMGHNLSGWVAAHRRTIVNSDAALDLANVLPSTERPHTCLSTPLVDGNTLVGVLTFYADATEPFGEDHGRLAQRVAPDLARIFTICRQSALECRPCGAAA
jgi:GAF domain-containing protein